MKVMITGAAGHIGTRLMQDLPRLMAGTEIVALDRRSLPKDMKGFCHKKCIVLNDIYPIMVGCDCVIHLAALTDVAASFSQAAEYDLINRQGAINVFESAKSAGCRVIFASTHAQMHNLTVGEDDHGPAQNPYEASKFAAEDHLRRMNDARWVTLCLGTVYGASPGMRFNTAVNRFCKQAVDKQPLSVYATAWNQERPYLYMGDLSQAIAMILRANLFDNRAYNLASGHHTVKDIVAAIQSYIPGAEVGAIESPAMNDLRYKISTTRIQDAGWIPKGDLKEGVGEIIGALTRRGQAA